MHDRTDPTDLLDIRIIMEGLVLDRMQVCVVNVRGCKKLNYMSQTESSFEDFRIQNVRSMYLNGLSKKKSERNY